MNMNDDAGLNRSAVCGFNDVRNEPDGSYKCVRCGNVFDEGWFIRMQRVLGRRRFNRLNEERMLAQRSQI